jgi:pimeloyl-ACP methyl ester carboxylesterase
MQLFTQETGGGGETVVLIHGFAGSHAVWRDVAPALADTFRVIAYDLPGHGNSHPWPETASPRIAVRALLDDLERRGLERVHLAGHSMGGAIAMLMALGDPKRVASLTLLAPGGMGPEINARLLRRHAAATSNAEIRACLEAMTGWETAVDDAAIAEELEIRARDGQVQALSALASAITRDGWQGVIPRDQLATLSMPVAVVWGSIDNVLPVAHVSELPPQFAVHVLPHVGHMLPVETPQFVAELIARMAR